METVLVGPAKFFFIFMPTVVFSFFILVVGTSIFSYIFAIRIAPLIISADDSRFNNFFYRSMNFFKIWLLQYRHPRYMFAGIIHISIFIGFIILSIRSIELVVLGLYDGFIFPGFSGRLGVVYGVLKNYTSTLVLISCFVAFYRRAYIKPDRYIVPKQYGKDHVVEALFVLGIIAFLMISENVFEVTSVVANKNDDFNVLFLPPLTFSWFLGKIMSGMSFQSLQTFHIVSYYLHDLLFFFFLCFLPFGKHFHVITSLFNVFFMRDKNGSIKPVKYGVKDNELDDLNSFGVKKLEDFTWKHILDFYSCADCGRCSDNCPANRVGRPLSPRFISIKGRNLVFKNYPVYPYGSLFKKGEKLVGNIFFEDEILSCTTCGACEAECPLGIEYIDKIVDLRRGMVDDGFVPQSIQKPLNAIEKRGNPWGKLEKKRIDWTKGLPSEVDVKILDKGFDVDTLYFVDSITSYDDRMHEIAVATSTILSKVGENFGILGKKEKDSGNEVRRFGEEMLFQMLRDFNAKNIIDSNVKRIVVSDPHSFNTLKNEYIGIPEVIHITEFVASSIKSKKIELEIPNYLLDKTCTYHDPCYLGRHNGIYESPRAVIKSIKDLSFVEMIKNKDRSFCCGGGGLMLFHEVEEEERMGVVRVKMAFEAGANVIITGCPFCLVNIEDAIKIAGFEGQIDVLDFTELVLQCMN